MDQMKAFGISTGKYGITTTGYLSGEGYLEMNGEDIVIASKLEQKLNGEAFFKEHLSERLRYVIVKERHYIVGKQFRTGRFCVMGMKDPKAKDLKSKDQSDQSDTIILPNFD
jgi:hypothetical protein